MPSEKSNAEISSLALEALEKQQEQSKKRFEKRSPAERSEAVLKFLQNLLSDLVPRRARGLSLERRIKHGRLQYFS